MCLLFIFSCISVNLIRLNHFFSYIKIKYCVDILRTAWNRGLGLVHDPFLIFLPSLKFTILKDRPFQADIRWFHLNWQNSCCGNPSLCSVIQQQQQQQHVNRTYYTCSWDFITECGIFQWWVRLGEFESTYIFLSFRIISNFFLWIVI